MQEYRYVLWIFTYISFVINYFVIKYLQSDNDDRSTKEVREYIRNLLVSPKESELIDFNDISLAREN